MDKESSPSGKKLTRRPGEPSALELGSSHQKRVKARMKLVRAYEFSRFNEQTLAHVYDLLLDSTIILESDIANANINSKPEEKSYVI